MSSAQFCPLTKLEKLLLATDRSSFSEGAEREAVNIAKKCSSHLYVVSVMESNPEYETIGSNFFDREEEEIMRYLESFKKRATQEGITCEISLLHGESAFRTIVHEATEKGVDLIIIGRHGRTGLTKVLMGKVAANVIGSAPCKVLIVPKAARIEYRKILVATDGSVNSLAAATEAIGIAKRYECQIIAVSVMRSQIESEEAKTNVSKVVKMAQKEGMQVEALTPLGKPHEAIVETASGMGVDLIVMGKYGKTGLKKLFMGSATENVIGLSGCAILVV
ncbi:MAG: universal stress protein [Dissulfurispiraceae bacterium]